MTLSFTYTSTTTKKRTIHSCVVPSIDSSIIIQNYFNNHSLIDTIYDVSSHTYPNSIQSTIYNNIIGTEDYNVDIIVYTSVDLFQDLQFHYLSSYNLNNDSSTSQIVDPHAVLCLEPNVCSSSFIQVDPSVLPHFNINKTTRDVPGPTKSCFNHCEQTPKSCLLSTLLLTFRISQKYKYILFNSS